VNHKGEEKSQLIAVGLYESPPPRALTYLGPTSEYLQLSPSLSFKNVSSIRKRFKNLHDTGTLILIVTPTSQILLPVLAIALPKSKLVLDLGWPMSDQAGISRKVNALIKRIKNHIVDFTAMQMSDLLIVETNAQVQRVGDKFWVSKKKIKRVYTSLDESIWNVNPKPINLVASPLAESQKIIILFRGKYNKESGIENILEFASNLEDKFQVIIATDKLPRSIFELSNTIVLEQFLEYSELAYLYSIADLCLGQLSADPRISHTLPHKYVESGFFGKPYLSFESPPLQEEGPNGGLIAISNLNDISEVLRQETKSSLSVRGKLNREYYEQHLSQKVVIATMEELIREVV
jgi:hypothetical protein